MKKRIIYTDHALERMNERGISKDAVRNTVVEPTIEMDGTTPRTKRARKDITNGGTLEVIYKVRATSILIITTWWRS